MSDDVAKVCHHCDHAAASADETTCPKHDLVLVDPAEHAKDPMDPFLGRTLGGRYPIVGIIGAGGMGAVYRAIQQPVGREVALKVIRNWAEKAGMAEVTACTSSGQHQDHTGVGDTELPTILQLLRSGGGEGSS